MALNNEQCPAQMESEVAGPMSARVFASCDQYTRQDVMHSDTAFNSQTAQRNSNESGNVFVERCQTLTEKCLLAEICRGKKTGMSGWRPIDKDKHPRLNFGH